jgi:proteic killer suppression protein
MIVTIAHKGLRLLWEKDDPSKLPPMQVDKIRRLLTALDIIKTLDPLRRIPGYRLHALTGDLKGYWSVTVTGNYRIIFQFENENVYLMDYLDYH